MAEGLTNPQIAGRLLVAPATVKAHLLHVFAKVGVSTRSELAAAAARAWLSAESQEGTSPQISAPI